MKFLIIDLIGSFSLILTALCCIIFPVHGRNLDKNDLVTFRLVLRQCNQDQLKKLVRKISDIEDDAMFGKFLSPKELRDMLKCDDYDTMKEELTSWLNSEKDTDSDPTDVFNEGYDYLNIISDASTSMVIEVNAHRLIKLFPRDEFYFNEDENRIMLLNKNKGQYEPTLPLDNLHKHVHFILGFTADTKESISSMSILGHTSTEGEGSSSSTTATGKETNYEKFRRKLRSKFDLFSSSSLPRRKNGGEIRQRRSFSSTSSSSTSSSSNSISDSDSVKNTNICYIDNSYFNDLLTNGNDENPATLSRILNVYGIPENNEKYYSGQLGFAEFGGQAWSSEDLSLFLVNEASPGIPSNPLVQISQDMFNYWMVTDDESVKRAGGEANLDMQLVAGIAQGVPIASYMPGGYDYYESDATVPLSWQLDVLENDYLLPPVGPYVWSMSYGFPEVAAGLRNSTLSVSKYIDASETNFASLASLGVTVVISSGDDGACNGNPACQSDPAYPVTFEGYEALQQDSRCNSFVISAELEDGTVYRCTIPMGYDFSATPENGLPGAECYKVVQYCSAFYLELQNKIGDEITLENKNKADGECPVTIDQLSPTNFVMVNDTNLVANYTLIAANTPCECGDIKPMQQTISTNFSEGETVQATCTLQGFEYDQAIYKNAYWASYPAASEFVTAVGSTAFVPPGDGDCNTTQETPTFWFSPGGGFSTLIDQPSYQTSTVNQWSSSDTPKPNSTMYNTNMRGYPDISAIGQDVKIYDDGKVSWTGGTSASAPIIASIVARLNNLRFDEGMVAIGELNPHLYRMNASAFNRIPQLILDYSPDSSSVNITLYGGNNISDHFGIGFATTEAFTPDASLPWDPVLGLGTPRWSEWEAYFVSSASASNGGDDDNTNSDNNNSGGDGDDFACSPSKSVHPLIMLIIGLVGGVLATMFTIWLVNKNRRSSKENALMSSSYTSFNEDNGNNVRNSHNML